jgi:hypothetical protein
MPHYGTFTELSAGERHCTCCKRDLSGHAFRWLELDQRTQTYHDDGDVPADRSQGWFPFGLTCAKKLVAAHKRQAA